MMLVASTGLHLEGITEEKPTQQGQESLVRGGLTPSLMTICSPMLVTTTTVGILLEVVLIKFGASPLTPTCEQLIVQFQCALL